jgi:hypothetical protein
MVTISDLNSQKMQNIKIGENHEISLDEFVSKVITASAEGQNHSENKLDWEYLGKAASLFGKRSHTMDFMLGPLSVERKEIKKARSVRLTKNKEDLVMPTKVNRKKCFFYMWTVKKKANYLLPAQTRRY